MLVFVRPSCALSAALPYKLATFERHHERTSMSSKYAQAYTVTLDWRVSPSVSVELRNGLTRASRTARKGHKNKAPPRNALASAHGARCMYIPIVACSRQSATPAVCHSAARSLEAPVQGLTANWPEKKKRLPPLVPRGWRRRLGSSQGARLCLRCARPPPCPTCIRPENCSARSIDSREARAHAVLPPRLNSA